MRTVLMIFYFGCLMFNFSQAQNEHLVLAVNSSNELPSSKASKPKLNAKFVPLIEVQATFPGGNIALVNYLEERLIYPELAIRNNREGIVIVEFEVTAKGVVKKPHVIQSLGLGCDKIALRAIKKMPKWTPAQQGTYKVSSVVRVPIVFYLN